MALTLESFCRYASSTCQRTSSDREPTLRSSKFWGGRLLASRLCKASYKFVCCGRERAWCSLGRPIGVEGSPGCWLFTVALGAASRCAQAIDEGCWPSVAALPRHALPAGCALPEQLFGAGCERQLHAQTAPETSIGAIRTPPGGDATAVWFRVRLKFTSSKTGARATDASGAAQLRTHAAVVPQRQHLPHSKCTRIG